MAAKAPTGEIWLGTIAKFTWFGMVYIRAKFHAFTTTCTIHSIFVTYSGWTKDLPRQCTLLKRLRVGTGCYRSSTKKCGMTDSEACQWDESEQTAEHKSSRRPACSKEDQRHWVDQQDTELINDDIRRRFFRCGPAMSVAKQTTQLDKLNYNMSRDYESYYDEI